MDDLETIYENVTELVRPRMHRQEVSAYVGGEWRRKQRDVEIPSLLDQLQAAFVSSSSEQSGSGFGSRPNARIDAVLAVASSFAGLAARSWLAVLQVRAARTASAGRPTA